MEYDKWTRKLIKIVEGWGFIKGPNIAGSHIKWTYKGPKADREFSIVIPRYNKSGIRAKTIGRIKQNMRAAGVNNAELEAFNKLALGLMQAQPDDDYDDLEEKLAAAMAANRALDAAENALEIGKRAGASGQTNYKSRAIEDVKKKSIAAANVVAVQKKIDKLLLQQLHMMMRTYFKSGEDFSVSRSGAFAADSMSELPDDLCKRYGIRFTDCEGDDYSTDIEAIFTGDADIIFAAKYGFVQFRTTLSIEIADDYATTEDSKDFYSVTTRLPHGRTLQEIKNLHNAIESFVTETAMKQEY